MQSKVITHNEFKKAVEISFKDDNKITEFYDSSVKIDSIDDIISDISSKIKEYKDPVLCGLFENNEVVGYYVFQGNLLISFALSIKYRTKKYLKSLFHHIKKSIGDSFICLLWSKNVRAIKWLNKMGMKTNKEIVYKNKLVTLLIH